LTSVNEEKSIYPLKVCSEVCATNLIKLASGNTRLNRIPTVFAGLFVISLGSEEGILVFNDFVQVGAGPGNMKLQTTTAGVASLKGD
jgi:hypothetical protein